MADSGTIFTIANILENLTPIGYALASFINRRIESGKKEKAETAQLMYNVYGEVKKNLDNASEFKQGVFRTIAVNSPKCKEIAAGFSTTAMTDLYKKHSSIKNKKKKEAIIDALDKSIQRINKFRTLTEMSDKIVKIKPKTNIELRLRNIKQQQLALYNALFKKR